jgi:protein O-GlcNAc transferase
MNLPTRYQQLMDHGAELHQAGLIDHALLVFEQALAMDATDPNAASACATLLSELGRPHAAYLVLQGASAKLMTYADGAANMAIAAETCGAMDDAMACYRAALHLDPNHVRSLNNTAILDAAQGRWDVALEKRQRCVELLPDEIWLHINLIDTLMGARLFDRALQHVGSAVARCGSGSAFAVRRAAVLALKGDLPEADRAFAAFEEADVQTYRAWLLASSRGVGGVVRPPSSSQALPDARTLFLQQVFSAMQVCDWSTQALATQVIADMVTEMEQTGVELDLREAQFYALLLPTTEAQQTSLRFATGRVIQHHEDQGELPTPPLVGSGGTRIHVGISCESLADVRYATALRNQIRLHDAGRFHFTIYSPTLQPRLVEHALFAEVGATVVEIAHMNDTEAALRIRLDRLDIWMDTAFYTPWCRPELPALRVAPIQIRQQTWQRMCPPIPCEYAVGDHFTHPSATPGLSPRFGAIVRFPHTCWLSTDPPIETRVSVTREEVGLSPDAFVLYCGSHALMVDPHSFAVWMAILKANQRAVLWFPGYAPAARQNLRHEAMAAGVEKDRILFCDRVPRDEHLARIALADLFVDTLRFNANQGLIDALQMGLPAITCAGENMASRLGGSILTAAGLSECVVNTASDYIETALMLAQSPQRLSVLRARLTVTQKPVPLLDTSKRLREWEYAWTRMVERRNDHLPPAAFDVPDLGDHVSDPHPRFPA